MDEDVGVEKATDARAVLRDEPPTPSVALHLHAESAQFSKFLRYMLRTGKLLQKDVQAIAAELLTHFHLNPAKHYPAIFLDAAGKLTDARLWTLAALAAVYGSVRFIEAYGLWRERRWAEWLAAGSGGLYIPFEIYEMRRGVAWLSVAALVINVAIVGVMVDALRHQRAAGP